MSSRLSETLRNVGEAAAALLEEMPEERRLSRRTGTKPHFDLTHVPSEFLAFDVISLVSGVSGGTSDMGTAQRLVGLFLPGLLHTSRSRTTAVQSDGKCNSVKSHMF